MIGLTFSPGKWIGIQSQNVAWVTHAMGVIAADKIGGGQHVNPSVSVGMFSLGKSCYQEMVVRIAGSMGGGLIAFPLFQYMTTTLGWVPLGGPEYNADEDDVDASLSAQSEFFATFLLMIVIFIVNWELNFGKYHYWIKQTLTAIAIRFLIEVFPKAGPAMNPMLGTTWMIFALNGGIVGFPDDVRHYYVYWVASILGALVACLAYAIYDGTTFFGRKLPIGPIKTKKVVATTGGGKKKKN
jgi:glycerol uptake facilitator-like aquaporin